MKKDDRLYSEIIAEFLNMVQQAAKDYTLAVEKVGDADKATTDLLHNIEFTSNYNERNKMATQLHTIRTDRRYYKDMREETEPIVDYFNENRKAINQLKEVLGHLRKVEKYHKNRSYIPRILK